MNNTTVFDEYRGLLFAIAYRMTGAVMDAEDLVQEAWIRWQAVDFESVQSPKAYLTSIVTRLAIDHLRSARVKREVYVGQWLPEPLFEAPATGPAETAELADSLSTAFMVLLESLSPPERAAFLLREIFGYDYAEVAAVVDKTEANCRQMVKRARDHLAEGKSRFEAEPADHARLVEQFHDAVYRGNMEALLGTLAEDAVLYADHGGKALAARRPIYTGDKIARFFLGLRKRFEGLPVAARITPVNGRLGIVTYVGGLPHSVLTFEIEASRITRVFSVNNPEKLQRIQPMGSGPNIPRTKC